VVSAQGRALGMDPSIKLIHNLSLPAGHLQLEEGTQMVMPGDNFRTNIELNLPVALEVGVRFAIRDSGRTVGAGVVTELLGK